jgi:hypothetical protein
MQPDADLLHPLLQRIQHGLGPGLGRQCTRRQAACEAVGSRRAAFGGAELAQQLEGGLVGDAEAGARRVAGDRLPVLVLVLGGGPGARARAGPRFPPGPGRWAEATRLTTGEPAIVPDSAVPLDTLRQNEVAARTALEQRAAQSVLADRVQGLTRQVAEADAEVARHPDEL